MAVNEGLNVISTISSEGMARDIAAAFIDQRPLDPVIDEYGSIKTDHVHGALNHYLATELRRIARQRGMKAEDLCDKSKRTLLNWAKNQ